MKYVVIDCLAGPDLLRDKEGKPVIYSYYHEAQIEADSLDYAVAVPLSRNLIIQDEV